MNNDLLMIVSEDQPCWFELSFQKKGPAIILKVHEDFVNQNPAVPTDSPLVQSYIKEFNLSEFYGDFKNNFGFKEAKFKNLGIKNNFYEYLVKIPKVRTITKKVCSSCRGTKVDIIDKELKCRACNGTGKQYENKWQKIKATCLGLNVFFSFSYMIEKRTSCPLPQLMLIDTYIGEGNASLGGVYSVSFVDWLIKKCKDKEHTISFPGINEAMKETYGRMFGKRLFSKYDFRNYIRDGGLIISCPGQACDIEPNVYGSNIHKGRGYNFGCHNVDTIAQQITLISGLALIHDIARLQKPD